MLIGAIVGLSLFATASVEPGALTPDGSPSPQMSPPQQDGKMRPLVRSAPECLPQTVSGDARFADARRAGDFTELIVDAMKPCLTPVRAMIDGYDRLYGDGSGEAFFMGPYLDVLPGAITRTIEGTAR